MNAIFKDSSAAAIAVDPTEGEGSAIETPVELGNLSRSVCHMIRRANLELARRFMSAVGHQHSIRPGVMGILMVTGMNPGIGQVDIAHQLGLDKANAAELIRSLEAEKWITRKRSTKDRRRQGVYLTAMGVQRLLALHHDTRKFEEGLLSSFSPEERDMLLVLLKRVTFPS
jgi:DNA-binding MarR family transcriptional regulator